MIVSDSTPLIYLARIGELKLLKEIYGRVYIPEQVYEEVVVRGEELGKHDASVINSAISDWIFVKEVQLPVIEFRELHIGECAVLELAKHHKINKIIMDDESGARVAKLLGFEVHRTVGILLDAVKMKLITAAEFEEKLLQLNEEGFWLSADVFALAVKTAKIFR